MTTITETTTLSDLQSILETRQATVRHIIRFPKGWSVELRSSDKGVFEVSGMPTIESALNHCLDLMDVAPHNPPSKTAYDRLPFPFVEARIAEEYSGSPKPAESAETAKKSPSAGILHFRDSLNTSRSICKAIITNDPSRFASDASRVSCMRCNAQIRRYNR
jgi:hypothetical protein